MQGTVARQPRLLRKHAPATAEQEFRRNRSSGGTGVPREQEFRGNRSSEGTGVPREQEFRRRFLKNRIKAGRLCSIFRWGEAVFHQWSGQVPPTLYILSISSSRLRR